jgi:phosphoethanolamine N-methyltransferase
MSLEVGYDKGAIGALEADLGDGFLSPGGVASIGWMLEGKNVSGLSVLDLGCGTGGPACLLAQQFGAAHVTGVDVGAYQVERATAAAAVLGIQSKTTFLQIDGRSLPFDTNHFDLVFSKDAIVHVADKGSLFRDLFRVLRPGGRLIVSDHLYAGGAKELAAFQDCWALSQMTAAPATLQEMEQILHTAGFADFQSYDRTARYMEPQEPDAAASATQPAQPDAQAASDWRKFLESYVLLMTQGTVLFAHIYANRPKS